MPHPIKRERGPYRASVSLSGNVEIDGPGLVVGLILSGYSYKAKDLAKMWVDDLNTAFAAGRRSVEAKRGRKG